MWSEWDKLKKLIMPMIKNFKILAEYLVDNCDIDVMAELQQNMIVLGTMLEEQYGLHETKIIRLLETYCEYLADYADKKGAFDTSFLTEELEEFMPALRESLGLTSLSVVLIIKDEGKYILEWLEYHLMAGVQHFYIYDNESTDDTKKLLREYIDAGVITYHYWPGKKQQLPAYNHAIENYKNDTEYMAFIDADEFLISQDGRLLPNVIDDIFETHVGYYSNVNAAGIAVNWRTYGTSFHKNVVNGLITRNYVYRGADLSEMNKCIKTICIPRKAKGFTKNPHEVDYVSGYVCISENGSYVMGPWFYDGMCNKLRVNHYFSKSREECYNRFKKGKADSTYVWPEERIEWECNRAEGEYNAVYDFIMERYVDELERRVQTSRNKANDNPRVSVIIPTYNRQDKIVNSIKSVLAQTYTDFELIIVDDGSTDDTQKVIAAILDERVKYVRLSKNMGAASARNEGAKIALGELLAFHDSDDEWRPEKLEKQIKYLEEHSEFSMVYCAYQYNKGNANCRIPVEGQEGVEGDILLNLLIKNSIGTPTMLIRRDCFFDVGGFNSSFKCIEDWEFAIRFAEKYYIGFVNEVLVDAFYSEGSVSAQTARYCETRCYMIAKYKDYLIRYDLFDTVVGKFFRDVERAGLLEEVKEMLKVFILAEEGMNE